jgi:hypothetical protein
MKLENGIAAGKDEQSACKAKMAGMQQALSGAAAAEAYEGCPIERQPNARQD